MNDHTPGPWRLRSESQHQDVKSFWSESKLSDSEIITSFATAFAFGTDVAAVPLVNKSDARLIAAAPDLLAACQVSLLALCNDDMSLSERAVAVEALRDAMAKARGR